MAVLLLAEVTDGALNMDATAKAVTAAAALGEVTVLCTGASAAAAGETAATIDGVARVLVAEDASLGHRLAEPTAALIVSLAGDYSHIVAPATTDAKNILPRVAALLDVMVISDVSGIVDGDTFERPIYAGNAVQTVKSADPVKVVSVLHSSFDCRGGTGGSARSRRSCAVWKTRCCRNGSRTGGRERPCSELTSCGHRRLRRPPRVGSEDDFALIEKSRDKLGRCSGGEPCGGSIPGFAPTTLVGGVQTGKVRRTRPLLSPSAISRARFQHLAGDEGFSRSFVAINKDEEAPIFQVRRLRPSSADLFTACSRI